MCRSEHGAHTGWQWVQAEAEDRPHFKQPSPDREKEIPKVEFDYCFPSDRAGERITVFTAVDQWTQSPLAVMARAKDRSRTCMCGLGTHGQSSRLLDDVARRTYIRHREGPRVVRNVRSDTLAIARANVHHASSTRGTPVGMDRQDTTCTFKRQGVYKHEVFEFGEHLLNKAEKRPKLEPRWEIGVYVSRLAKANEAALNSESRRSFQGTRHAEASAGEKVRRRCMYITKARREEYGATPGCKG
eukprot:3737274-Amphidinium_carterae.1